MKAAGIRNVDVARALDLDPSTISKYRSGEREPAAYELAEMVERAAGSADEVLGLKSVAIDPALVHEAVAAARRLTAAAPQLQESADRPGRGRATRPPSRKERP